MTGLRSLMPAISTDMSGRLTTVLVQLVHQAHPPQSLSLFPEHVQSRYCDLKTGPTLQVQR